MGVTMPKRNGVSVVTSFSSNRGCTYCRDAGSTMGGESAGAAVLVGVLPMTETVELSASDITLSKKRVLGSFMGSNAFRRDMPHYVDFYLDGRLHLDEMSSQRIPIEQVNAALDAMRKGEVARSVIVFDD